MSEHQNYLNRKIIRWCSYHINVLMEEGRMRTGSTDDNGNFCDYNELLLKFAWHAQSQSFQRNATAQFCPSLHLGDFFRQWGVRGHEAAWRGNYPASCARNKHTETCDITQCPIPLLQRDSSNQDNISVQSLMSQSIRWEQENAMSEVGLPRTTSTYLMINCMDN